LTKSGDWIRWEDLYEKIYHLAALADALADFIGNAASSRWLYREIEIEASAIASVARAYIAQTERPSRSEWGPFETDPQQWQDERPLLEDGKDGPDEFRASPKPRDPRRGKRGDHE
jgi:hypothetical protein